MSSTALKRLLPFYRNYEAALTRISALEMAFTIMLGSPRYVTSPAAGFNGQAHRKRMFQDIMQACAPGAIVETGTFVGDTTGYMSEITAVPIHTCEANPTFQSLAKSRLREQARIVFHAGDSRSCLRRLLANELAAQRETDPIFFYLDAHWHHDLPLAEEIELIAANVARFVVMIDDFQVPGDAGYGYDNYGPKKALDLATFGTIFRRLDLTPFFPSLPAAQETGGRRGSIVLTRTGPLAETLRALPSLRPLADPLLLA